MSAGPTTASNSSEGDWVEEALNVPGRWGMRGIIPYLLGFMMLFDSWDSTVIAYTLPSISAEWSLSTLEAGWLVSVGFGGQFIGALVFGALAERFGRIPMLRVLIFIMSVLAIGCALSESYLQLVGIRFIQGLAIGGAMPIAMCYINEIAPTKTRGKFFGTFQFIMLSGFGLAAMSSAWIVPNFGWRTMFWIGATPLLFIPLLFIFPESPRWLATRNRAKNALFAMRKLGLDKSHTIPIDDKKLGGMSTTTPVASPLELLGSKVRGRSLVVAAMWFLTSLVGFGLVTWAPSIYVNNFNMPVDQALRYTSMGALAIFFTPLLLRQVIDKIGRRPPGFISTGISAAALLAMVLVPVDRWGILVSLLILGHVGISIGTMVLWPYTAEIFDTRLRAVAMGTVSSLARAASMLTPLAVGGVIELTGSVHLVFALFGLSALVVSLLWLFATKETAGRALDS